MTEGLAEGLTEGLIEGLTEGLIERSENSGNWCNMRAKVIVDIVISAEEFQRLYRGSARSVCARARDGRRVKFPAHILRPYVTHTGIHGSFCIDYDQHNSFQQVKKID